MTTAKRYFARLLAVLAIAAVVVAVIVIVSNADLNSKDEPSHKKTATHQQQKQPRTKAKTYTVKSGDTLTSIAHKLGIPVSEIQALNPEVDPQILRAGETLKLQ
jgi:LysM repeat protein